MEIQYLDNITKKIIFAPVMVWERILNFELGGTSGSASRTGDCGTGGTSGTGETSGTGGTSGTGETSGTGGASGTGEEGIYKRSS